MTDATLPPQEPGPEPDTSTAAESEDPSDDVEPEDAPVMTEGEDVEQTPI